jgi:hypothetical protein
MGISFMHGDENSAGDPASMWQNNGAHARGRIAGVRAGWAATINVQLVTVSDAVTAPACDDAARSHLELSCECVKQCCPHFDLSSICC